MSYKVVFIATITGVTIITLFLNLVMENEALLQAGAQLYMDGFTKSQ
jgi:hypothetical protein